MISDSPSSVTETDDARRQKLSDDIDPASLSREQAEEILLSMGRGITPKRKRRHNATIPSVPLARTHESKSDSEDSALQLRQAEARYRTLVEQIPAITFMASLDGGASANEIYVSPHIETMLGFTQEEWLGDPFLWYRQLHPEDRVRWHDEFARTCSSGTHFKSEYRFISCKGETVWVHGEAKVVRGESGEPLFLQGIAFNITESKRAEETLRRSGEELERKVRERTVELVEANKRAEAASHSRAQFLANMSHEIRTPLNGIIGFADLLCKNADSDEDERREWHETIRSSGNHLLSLINDILDLSKIDAGKMEIELIECPLIDLVNEVVTILRQRADKKGLRLYADFVAPLPARITTDPVRLKQIIMNVVGNSIKFTESGEIKITVRLYEADNDRSKLQLAISDTGIGIPQDKLESIFEQFTQADASTTRKYGGTGLGLSICKQLCEALGGSIRVESVMNEGSTFICEIDPGPLNGIEMIVDNDAFAERNEKKADETSEQVSLPYKILVVDDSEVNRKLAGLVLKRAGATMSYAENGAEAVDAVTSETFDIVLMDMQMPVMSGEEATRALRARGYDLPIIALTAHAMRGTEQHCLDQGFSGYVSKPINPELLVQTIADLISANVGSLKKHTQASIADEAKSPSEITHSEDGSPICSTLPTDDADFREIVEEFIQTMEQRMVEMHRQFEANEIETLADSAHWLKGSGGMAGFDVLTKAAAKLESSAQNNALDQIKENLMEIDGLVRRITV